MDLFGVSEPTFVSEPTLSIVTIMKMTIKKLYIASPTDEQKIKAIKSAELAKIDHRFPNCDRVTLHQFLDPHTKIMTTRTSASILMEEAVKDAIERKLITVSDSDLVRGSNDTNIDKFIHLPIITPLYNWYFTVH